MVIASMQNLNWSHFRLKTKQKTLTTDLASFFGLNKPKAKEDWAATCNGKIQKHHCCQPDGWTTLLSSIYNKYLTPLNELYFLTGYIQSIVKVKKKVAMVM